MVVHCKSYRQLIEILSGVSHKISSFLQTLKRVKRLGGKRWVSEDGSRYYEWDSLHGEIEVYNKKGKHRGVLNPDGTVKKGATKGRKINV